jgi:hypothetical protein
MDGHGVIRLRGMRCAWNASMGIQSGTVDRIEYSCIGRDSDGTIDNRNVGKGEIIQPNSCHVISAMY